MLNHLLYFQFPFMYLLALVMGLVVYGSDFDGITGWLYLAPLLLLTILHRRLWAMRLTMASGNATTLVSAIGIVVGIWVYTPLHMNYWDEHSLNQAVGMAILGVCSYLLSVVGAVKINNQPTSCPRCAIAALAIIGALWWPAVYYPMIVVLFLVIVFIIAAIWSRPLISAALVSASAEKSKDTFAVDVIARYAVFILAIDISSVIWDFQVNTEWALYVSISFMAAAVGNYLKSSCRSGRAEQTVYALALVNFMIAVVWPPYLLWIAHAALAGIALGYLLPNAMSQSDSPTHSIWSMGWTVWFFMGLAMSNAWYANLQWAATRLVLLLPFVLLAIGYIIFRSAAIKHQH